MCRRQSHFCKLCNCEFMYDLEPCHLFRDNDDREARLKHSYPIPVDQSLPEPENPAGWCSWCRGDDTVMKKFPVPRRYGAVQEVHIIEADDSMTGKKMYYCRELSPAEENAVIRRIDAKEKQPFTDEEIQQEVEKIRQSKTRNEELNKTREQRLKAVIQAETDIDYLGEFLEDEH